MEVIWVFGFVVCKTECLFSKYSPELLMKIRSQQTAISGSRASLEALRKNVSQPKADVLSLECSKAGAGINRYPDFYQACQEDKQPFKSRISHFNFFFICGGFCTPLFRKIPRISLKSAVNLLTSKFSFVKLSAIVGTIIEPSPSSLIVGGEPLQVHQHPFNQA